MRISEATNIEMSPELFRQPDFLTYPSDNEPPFENWYGQEMISKGHPKTERIYLCIYWTAYYKNANYGKNEQAMLRLQLFLDGLDRTKKYYSLIQYDDGLLNDVSHLDLKMFCMNGKDVGYPLPLICQPHKFNFLNTKRDIFACFVGANTHPVREQMMYLNNYKDYLVTFKRESMSKYCNLLSRSVFCLAPMGYGLRSFRECEGLMFGAIPVIITSFFASPHYLDSGTYSIVIRPDQVSQIDKILKSKTQEEISSMQQEGAKIFSQYYTFEANRDIILKNI